MIGNMYVGIHENDFSVRIVANLFAENRVCSFCAQYITRNVIKCLLSNRKLQFYFYSLHHGHILRPILRTQSPNSVDTIHTLIE